MVDDLIPSGDPTDASGDVDKKNQDKKDMVAFESHKKVLDEKKKLQARVSELEDAHKKRLEEEAKAKEDYKTLAETREKELAEERDKRLKSEKRIEQGVKLDAFLNELSGRLDNKYFKLIDFSSITLDEDGSPDEASVKKAVKDFETSHPEVILKESKSKMPNEAPKGGSGGKVKHADWVRMPPEEKKKYKWADVID